MHSNDVRHCQVGVCGIGDVSHSWQRQHRHIGDIAIRVNLKGNLLVGEEIFQFQVAVVEGFVGFEAQNGEDDNTGKN